MELSFKKFSQLTFLSPLYSLLTIYAQLACIFAVVSLLGLLRWKILQGANISQDNLNLFYFDLVFLSSTVIAVCIAAELCWAA